MSEQDAPKKKLTRAQYSSLGGLATAADKGPAWLRLRAQKAGQANVAKHGKEHMKRLALKRWGYDVELVSRSKKKKAADESAAQ